MSKPDLWMPLYFGAYLTDTMHLTTEQHGAYLLLLMAAWKRGGTLPGDDAQLGSIARLTPAQWRKARVVIEPFWSISVKGWQQKRLSKELDTARAYLEAQVENGRKGGRPRKPEGNPSDNPTETRGFPKEKATRKPDETPRPLPRPLPEPLPGPTPEPPRLSDAADAAPEPGRTVSTWKAYSTAYSQRYGVLPVRNKTVNALLARLVERVGLDEAPHVAAFYVNHNRQYYVARKHPVDMLVKDAEGLRTEWATGRTVTETEARQADKTAAIGNAFGELIEEARNARH